MTWYCFTRPVAKISRGKAKNGWKGVCDCSINKGVVESAVDEQKVTWHLGDREENIHPRSLLIRVVFPTSWLTYRSRNVS
jgi:hypothetical protein